MRTWLDSVDDDHGQHNAVLSLVAVRDSKARGLRLAVEQPK